LGGDLIFESQIHSHRVWRETAIPIRRRWARSATADEPRTYTALIVVERTADARTFCRKAPLLEAYRSTHDRVASTSMWLDDFRDSRKQLLQELVLCVGQYGPDLVNTVSDVATTSVCDVAVQHDADVDPRGNCLGHNLVDLVFAFPAGAIVPRRQ
jgi:hypothetical protein